MWWKAAAILSSSVLLQLASSPTMGIVIHVLLVLFIIVALFPFVRGPRQPAAGRPAV
jgi:hypothetical protein